MRSIVFCIFMIFTSTISLAQNKGKIIDVSCHDFKTLMDTCHNYVLLDVRLLEAFKSECIPGAISVANKALLESVTDTIDFDTPLLIYCEEGFRSSKASELLLEKGFLYIFNLDDGYWKWKRKNFPVTSIEK